MGRRFTPARWAGATIPVTQSMTYTAAQTFKRGAVLIFASGGAGTVEEGSTDPTPIVGVSAEPAASKPGYEIGHSSFVTSYTGRVAEVSVWRANRQTIFSGRAVNGSTDPVTPTQSHIDEVYGILKSSNDWVIDISETSNTRIEIVDVDITELMFFFKFMEAHLATP